jgi:hypothetical protein
MVLGLVCFRFSDWGNLFWGTEMKKIAFLYLLPQDMSGLLNKINSQAEAVYSLDKDIEFIIFYESEKPVINSISPNFIFEKLPKHVFKTGFFFTTRHIVNYVNQKKYDLIFSRIYGFSPFFFFFFKKRKFKFIVEYHTKIVNEYFALGRYDLALAYWTFKKLSDLVIDGKICVTNEIAKIESFNKPVITISNGFKHKKLDLPAFKYFKGSSLRILMVCSKLQPWHGIERFFESVRIWEVNNPYLSIKIDIVGEIFKNNFDRIKLPKYIVFHGSKNDNEIIELAKNANMGLSTLGLFLKNMDEACPLKSREYISLGLPFIYGYKDQDINSASDLLGFNVPNNNSLLILDDIMEWLHKIDISRDQYFLNWLELRKRISWESKMQQFLRFADEI